MFTQETLKTCSLTYSFPKYYTANHSDQEKSETLQYVLHLYICKQQKWLNWRGRKRQKAPCSFFSVCLKPSSYINSRSIHKLCNFWQSSSRNLNNPVFDLHTQGSPTQLFFIPSYKGNSSWNCVGVYRLCLTDICVTSYWAQRQFSPCYHHHCTHCAGTVLAEAVALPHDYIHKASGTSLSALPQSVLPEEYHFI